MPCLEDLAIFRPIKLRMIPEGLKFVSTLQKLSTLFQPAQLNERIRAEDIGERKEFYKVQHIPSVIVTDSEEVERKC